MVFSNVIVAVTVPRHSFVFSQSSVQISAGLTDISGLAVTVFGLINCSWSVLRLVFVFDVSSAGAIMALVVNEYNTVQYIFN